MTLQAESNSTPKSQGEQTDAIADLLIGEETDEVTEDLTEEETPTEESTESEESTDGETEEEETSLEDVADEDVSWGSVLGVDEDKLNFDEDGNITGVTVKVNGEVSQVPMNDLIAGYQLNKNVTQKSQALSTERKEFEEQKEQVTQAFNNKLQEVVGLSQVLEKNLISEFDSIDWEALRVQNPAEYAAMRQDYAARAQEMQGIKAAVAKQMQDAQGQIQQVQQEKQKAYLQEQYTKMLENNPTWTDEKAYNADMGRLQNFAQEAYGVSEEDFKFVKGDARVVELLKDAEKYHKGVQVAQNKIKKPVPKFQKSGGKPAGKVSKLQKLTKAAKSAKGSQKRGLQTEAVAELLLGNN